jgi:hypothetical protein
MLGNLLKLSWRLMKGAIAVVLLAMSPVALAQVTSLTMTSDAGDYIGQGQTYNFSPVDGSFTAQVNYQGGVSISFIAPNYTRWWYLDFSAPNSAPLAKGSYLMATRFPFNSGAGLSVSGEGRGCNTLTGSFNVRQIEYVNNTVASFEASFEQHCEGFEPALRGEIKYNASAQLYLTAPTTIKLQTGQTASFTVTATEAQNRRVTLTAPTLPLGATFTDNGNNQGTFWWVPTNVQTGNFIATFAGNNGQGVVAQTSSLLTVVPPPPFNDDISNPGVLPMVPTTASQVVTTASAANDDPYCFGNAQSVWYKFQAPSTMRVELNTFGSNYDTAIGVYTGTQGSLSQVACNGDAGGGYQSRVRFDAVAGTTYYVMVSSQYYPSPAANLVLNVLQAPPAFAFAPVLAPFSTIVSSTGAVTVKGSVRCNAPSFVSLSGSIRQDKNGVPINGYWSAQVPCNGVSEWSAPVSYQSSLYKGRSAALFSGGKATVGLQAWAIDPDSGEYRQAAITSTITLRGK